MLSTITSNYETLSVQSVSIYNASMKSFGTSERTSILIKPSWAWLSPSRNNLQTRVFGIVLSVEQLLHPWMYTRLARLSQNGQRFKKNTQEMERGLKNSMYGWKALEAILCCALIDRSKSFHFLPPHELDSYKIDLCSRVFFRKGAKVKSLCIGTQLTVAPLPWNKNYDKHNHLWTIHDNYEKKRKQMFAMQPYLTDELTRIDKVKIFWRLTTPDIISFLAVNGELWETFQNISWYTWNKFIDWSRSWFASSSIISHFKPKEQFLLSVTADFVDYCQKKLLNSEFQKHLREKWFEERITFLKNYEINMSFNKEWRELSFELSDKWNWEKEMRLVFFLSENTIQQLRSIHEHPSIHQ